MIISVYIMSIALEVPTTTASSGSTTYYVSTLGSDANDGLSWENAFATIQHAVDVASPGDTIIVGDGTYVESVLVGKWGMTIRSENGALKTVTQPPGQYESAFKVIENNVTISGFAVKNTIEFHPEDPRISYIRVPVAGILLSQVNNCNVSSNIAENNWNGIYLSYSGNNTLRNNIVENNRNGILLERSDNIALDNNTVENNQVGIHLSHSNNNTLKNNTAQNNQVGIHLSHSNNNTLKNNTAQNNGVGVRLDGSNNNTLKNNNISNNGGGIEFVAYISITPIPSHWCENNVTEYNNILNNDNGIYLSGTPANNFAHFNNITGNSEYGVFNESNSIFYAENNWWGDPSGPGGAGPGTGDAVSVNVIYEPWLDAPVEQPRPQPQPSDNTLLIAAGAVIAVAIIALLAALYKRVRK